MAILPLWENLAHPIGIIHQQGMQQACQMGLVTIHSEDTMQLIVRQRRKAVIKRIGEHGNLVLERPKRRHQSTSRRHPSSPSRWRDTLPHPLEMMRQIWP